MRPAVVLMKTLQVRSDASVVRACAQDRDAARSGCVEAVRWLLSFGGSALDQVKTGSLRRLQRRPRLRGAASRPRPAMTHSDVDPSCRDRAGATPLHFAASRGHCGVLERLLEMECCERLLAGRADPSDGFTPAHLAHYNGHRRCARYLRARHNNKDGKKRTVDVMDTPKQPESEETAAAAVAAMYPQPPKSLIPHVEKVQTAASVIKSLQPPKRTPPDANNLLADRKLLGDMKPIASLKQSSLSIVFTGQASKIVVLPSEEANLVDMDYLVPSHDEKGRPIAEWKRQVMVRQLQARLLDEEDQRWRENGQRPSKVNWRYSQAHNAILGPSGELLTEHDLLYLEEQIASVSLRRHAGEGYEAELARLADELRQILPAPIVNISARARFADPAGRPPLLPGWCGRISGIVKSMSLLTSDVAEQAHCKMADGQLAGVFSQAPERRASARGRRQRIEEEIRRFGVSVRTLKSNFETQNEPEDADGSSSASTPAPEPEEGKTVAGASLRKERIVVLFLGHWKKSAYAVALKSKDAAERKKSRAEMMSGSLGHFFKQRSAVNKMLGNWRRMISSVPSRQIRRLHRQQVLYSPEQFLPRVDGAPLEYDKLTLDLFMLGYFHILEQDLPVDERKMRHLLCFEVFDRVGGFPWELVRDFHKAVVRDIEAGDREWKDGFDDLKLKFFSRAAAASEEGEPEAEARRLPGSRPLPKVIVQTPTPDEGSDYAGTDISSFSNEEICQYIDRSFAFWKEKEAEIFDFE
ncbi:espin-like protein isoform X1 [Syngnathoides biaculeatus]|uniref:espin-like protein isoform X1 n=1 Tax=Syngnathoides biaculeatus TaxID=300417 RepID=UPI002ADDA103|nr:espin-like protein isoform X1 [Syngnathoides biaculeatus]